VITVNVKIAEKPKFWNVELSKFNGELRGREERDGGEQEVHISYERKPSEKAGAIRIFVSQKHNWLDAATSGKPSGFEINATFRQNGSELWQFEQFHKPIDLTVEKVISKEYLERDLAELLANRYATEWLHEREEHFKRIGEFKLQEPDKSQRETKSKGVLEKQSIGGVPFNLTLRDDEWVGTGRTDEGSHIRIRLEPDPRGHALNARLSLLDNSLRTSLGEVVLSVGTEGELNHISFLAVDQYHKLTFNPIELEKELKSLLKNPEALRWVEEEIHGHWTKYARYDPHSPL
jgi:hypothetical protein